MNESIQKHVSTIELKTRETQESSQELHKRIAESTQKVRELRIALDQQNAACSEIRIEKGQLEIKVEAAVQAIITECHTPLETALELPELENRAESEREAETLKRRIKNLGTVNPMQLANTSRSTNATTICSRSLPTCKQRAVRSVVSSRSSMSV